VDPIDLQVARWKAQADQLRSTVRHALLELGPGPVTELIRTCAVAHPDQLDERMRQLVGWLAIVAVVDLFDAPPPGDGKED
jgi:hypothetical protein